NMLFGAPALSYVLACPNHPDRGAGGVRQHLSVTLNDSRCAVAAHDPVLELARSAALECVPDRRFHAVSIVRVNYFEECFVGRTEAALVEPEDSIKLVRPGDLVPADLPLPASDPGDPFSLRE